MAYREARNASERVLRARGLSVPGHLPQGDPTGLRSVEEILSRMLCLNAVAASAHGFDRREALGWLDQHSLTGKLTSPERLFLDQGEGDPHLFMVQVEALWALAWVTNIVREMDFWQDCSSDFVTMLPNLKNREGIERISTKARMRDFGEVVEACDLSYCLHWTVTDALIRRQSVPTGLKPYLIIERRRALDWALSDDDWDEVSLDT